MAFTSNAMDDSQFELWLAEQRKSPKISVSNYETGEYDDLTVNFIALSLARDAELSKKGLFNLVDMGSRGQDIDGNEHSSLCFFLCVWFALYLDRIYIDNDFDHQYLPADLKNLVAYAYSGPERLRLNHPATDAEIQATSDLIGRRIIIEEPGGRRTFKPSYLRDDPLATLTANNNHPTLAGEAVRTIKLYLEAGHFEVIVDDYGTNVIFAALHLAEQSRGVKGRWMGRRL